MNPIADFDPRDYAIIRALGALCLAPPDIELAQLFLRQAGADERIHQAANTARRQGLLAQGRARRVNDRTIEITLPDCRLADLFEALQEDAQ
ncbi:hypothetical protein [Modicisalibacter radicis]|uniref:hypothetical protein n=1 Tax=Halomonas sp. EAR18 TaxID=2518972 RepID=UPI00109C817F|nr:hypothetical protein [Halomonas sp. EAR18]